MLELSIWRFDYWLIALILILFSEDQNEINGCGVLDSSMKERRVEKMSSSLACSFAGVQYTKANLPKRYLLERICGPVSDWQECPFSFKESKRDLILRSGMGFNHEFRI
jgi:hypothetical protein